MKIMVTGSRDHKDRAAVYEALMQYKDYDPHIIVGDCPTGVDNIVKQFCYQYDWPIEIFEADWLRYKRAAGPIRNARMVEQKPDICLAFPLGNSRGTRNAMKQAATVGIPVIEF